MDEFDYTGPMSRTIVKISLLLRNNGSHILLNSINLRLVVNELLLNIIQSVEYLTLENLVLRDDGLYRHSPLTDAAWGRGNAFPALGMALTLSDIPEDQAGFAELLSIYQSHIKALVPYQDLDGMWHEVIDYPGSYAELSATAMIATAIKRGVSRGWLDEDYLHVVDKAWRAVLMRSSSQGYFVNVCESTNKQETLEDYLNREALTGPDERAGGMLMMFATEMAELR